MARTNTGFGGETSIETGALVVAVVSSLLLLAVFLSLGRNFETSVFEVTVSGVVVGLAYYLGLRLRG